MSLHTPTEAKERLNSSSSLVRILNERINKAINGYLLMVKLMQQGNGQYMITLPQHIVRVLQAKKGDDVEFTINLKKGVVELAKSTA